MRTIISFLFLLLAATPASALELVSGRLLNQEGKSVAGASVALLYPEDSTLAFFAVSGSDGHFQVRGVRPGRYVLQAAVMGYYTLYRPLSVPADNNLGELQLEDNKAARELKGVVITGERIPLRIKGDTVEYDAAAYRVLPNAAAEDLLRQLPGMQVDEAGNVKAMGKDVKKILVDGKEFFGNDPKVATKNLPADAISRVQTYNKHSDKSEFTGIDDGQRNQTINLVLKAGKKQGYFGDVKAGAGTDEHYESRGKLFRFREKEQLAALGMLNNINQFGFSIDDYINFSTGGLSNISGSQRITISGDETLPVDFGQPVTGAITSGALGLNYSVNPEQNNRFALSYMGSGARKQLYEKGDSRNFLPGQTYLTADTLDAASHNIGHNLSLSTRQEKDSFRQITLNLNAGFRQQGADKRSVSAATLNDAPVNSQQGYSHNKGYSASVVAGAAYVRTRKGPWKLYQADLSLDARRTGSASDLVNQTLFYMPAGFTEINQYRNQVNTVVESGLRQAMTRSLGKRFYLEPALQLALKYDLMDRDQGMAGAAKIRIDSLSPRLYNLVLQASPGLSLRRSGSKTQWNLGLKASMLRMAPAADGQQLAARDGFYLLPELSWRHDISNGKNISLEYRTTVETPLALMLLPVTDYSNPLSRLRGNPELRPEQRQDLYLNYVAFDQFSMSSFFCSFNGSYTRDKFGYALSVNPDLSQDLLWVNTDYETQGTLRASYATPLRSLGLSLDINASEQLQGTLSPVNGINNRNTTWNHEFGFGLGNRGAKKLRLRGGGALRISDARYSLNQELNNKYYRYSGFANISWQPAKQWLFTATATVNHYAARSFNGSVTIPLLNLACSRFVLPKERGMITLSCFDLLNRNNALQRESRFNTLSELRANAIRRYLLCSFTYRLNKVGGAGPVQLGD